MRPLIGIAAQFDNATGNPFIDARYAAFVRAGGGQPVLLVPAESGEEACAVLARVDGVLIPGGDDMDPALYGQERLSVTDAPVVARDRWEPWLIRAALGRDVPLLGICRGAQMLQVVLGGPMVQDIPSQVAGAGVHRQRGGESEASHEVAVVDGSPLARVLAAAGLPLVFGVNSLHHQAVALPLAAPLTLMAACADGITEAVCVPDARFVWGVQWHPEMMPACAVSRLIAREFVRAASEYAQVSGHFCEQE